LSLILGGVLLSSVSATAALPLGNIEANTSVLRRGYAVGCVSALLIPRSPLADRNVELIFGNLDKGSSNAARSVTERLSGTRESRCNKLQTKGNYLFANVAPGQYYVVLRLTREHATHDKVDQADFDGLLMQRVTVSPSATARLRFD
jgi:hypothetical protein